MSRTDAYEQQVYEMQDIQEQAEERSDAELLYKLGFVPVVDIHLKSKLVTGA